MGKIYNNECASTEKQTNQLLQDDYVTKLAGHKLEVIINSKLGKVILNLGRSLRDKYERWANKIGNKNKEQNVSWSGQSELKESW